MTIRRLFFRRGAVTVGAGRANDDLGSGAAGDAGKGGISGAWTQAGKRGLWNLRQCRRGQLRRRRLLWVPALGI